MSAAIFFFNDTATTEIYTLSLHDALPIYARETALLCQQVENLVVGAPCGVMDQMTSVCGEEGRLLTLLRSEEHTSELQSRQYLVCRLLLEKKQNHLTYEIHLHIPYSYHPH